MIPSAYMFLEFFPLTQTGKVDWRALPDGERLAEPAHPEHAPANAYAFAAPDGFEPITQLEHARLGTVTPEMRRVAEREKHLTPEQVRDEVAAGRDDVVISAHCHDDLGMAVANSLAAVAAAAAAAQPWRLALTAAASTTPPRNWWSPHVPARRWPNSELGPDSHSVSPRSSMATPG